MLRYILLYICVLLTVCVFKITAQSGNAGDNDTDLLRYLSVISGLYTGQTIQDDGHVLSILKIVLPIETSAFYPALTYFMGESVGDEPPIKQIHVLHKSQGGLIVTKIYNFVGLEDMNITDIVKDVSIFQRKPLSDYYTDKNCDTVTSLVGNVYLINWPDCEHVFNNLIPIELSVWSCHELGYVQYKHADKITDNIFLQVSYKQIRYPLLSYMLNDAGNFTDPCV